MAAKQVLAYDPFGGRTLAVPLHKTWLDTGKFASCKTIPAIQNLISEKDDEVEQPSFPDVGSKFPKLILGHGREKKAGWMVGQFLHDRHYRGWLPGRGTNDGI